MKTKNYDEMSVVRSLNKVQGVMVNTNQKIVEVAKEHSAGNGSWGKIDYLCHYKGYIVLLKDNINSYTKSKMSEIAEQASSIIVDVDYYISTNIQKEKRINMAAMSKNIMKKVSSKK